MAVVSVASVHDPEKPVTGLDPVMDTGFAKRSCSGEKTRPGRYRMQSERRGGIANRSPLTNPAFPVVPGPAECSSGKCQSETPKASGAPGGFGLHLEPLRASGRGHTPEQG